MAYKHYLDTIDDHLSSNDATSAPAILEYITQIRFGIVQASLPAQKLSQAHLFCLEPYQVDGSKIA